jgi:two-component system, OmpR family, response regulator
MTRHDNRIKLFLVDDDAIFLKYLEIQFLQHPIYDIETYTSGELCLEHLSKNPAVVILDYHLDGIDKNAINGLETLILIKELQPKTPVVILSCQDKIEVAVNCMHHNAFDYVVKSETAFMRLRKIIDTIIYYQKVENKLNWYMDRM